MTAEQQAAARPRGRSRNELINMSGPLLELILKIKAGIITPSNDLRKGVEDLLKQFEQRAAALRFSPEQVKAVKFALVAFVDETVLTAKFPLRDEWEKYPLQLQYFEEHLAGVKFFERLDEMLKFTEQNADVIEVYYLCLLLGYKGKYKFYLEEQLKGVIAAVAEHLRRVGRLVTTELSPHWQPRDRYEVPPDPGLPLWVKAGSGIAVGLTVLVYMILLFLVISERNSVVEQLLQGS